MLIVREFDAPREQVFKAWSTRDVLERWHAPHGCSIEFKKVDFRVDATFHSVLETPTGYICSVRGTYMVIDEPAKIV